MAILKYIENDTLPGLSGALTDDNGDAEDITGYTITLHVKYPTALVKTAYSADPTTGEFVFTWDEGDLVAGTWRYEIQIAYSSTQILTLNRDSSGNYLMLQVDQEIA